MKRVYLFLFGLLFSVALVVIGFGEARADFELLDGDLNIAGFFRYSLAVHTGDQNPNNTDQEDNNTLNLARALFQTEFTYRPTDVFKLYTKIRFTHDATELLDDNLDEYDATPYDVPSGGWTLMNLGDSDHYRGEVWELYGDVEVGNLWARLGRQQIVWGEMIGLRIMDRINPLDMSWHLMFEPEEFENIRIPQWAIRAVYGMEQRAIPWLMDITLEGFLNPGDISPNVMPEFGSPFNLKPQFPPFFDIEDKDRRGDAEYGFRMGGRIGNFYGTLNYLHLFVDNSLFELTGITPVGPRPIPPILHLDAKYPETDIYGMTLNYASPAPLNLVVTFEGTYTPDQPYQDAKARPLMPGTPTPQIRDVGMWRWAMRFDRSTFVLPRPISAMKIQLQFSQTVVEDNDEVLGPNNSEIDATQNTLALILRQSLMHNNLEPSLKIIYDLDDAYLITPAVRYRYGDNWYFDLYGNFLGGSEDRPGRFGSMDWADEIVGRVTFQF